MRKKKINILFITEASMTGAPILLLEVLKVIAGRDDLSISILIKRDGKLVSEFSQYGKVYVLKGKLYQNRDPSFAVKLFRAGITFLKKTILYPQLKSTDVIISNTIINGNIIRSLFFLNAKVICYVHELENLMRTWKPQSDIANTFRHSHLYMVPSQAVKQNLIINHNVPEKRIRLFHTYLSVDAQPDAIQKQFARRKFCEKHNIAATALLVVGMGTADERKGIDLFIETARLNKEENIFFTWIGGFATDAIKDVVAEKIKAYDLGSKVIFTGPLPRSYTNLLPFDVFFLSSREDPYPLVVLEAAALGIPAVCFAPSGGIVDFVQQSGWVINDFSVESMAQKISYLHQHRQQLAEAGDKAHDNFLTLHNNRKRLVAQFDEIINTVLKLK
jgi:glycosyltransferase involved in cell wall biosynthesis